MVHNALGFLVYFNPFGTSGLTTTNFFIDIPVLLALLDMGQSP